MAESIVRLRVDSQEYDNKLKRAAEALNKYAEGCRKAGGTLEHVDEGVLEYARSLGKMETVSASVKGKLNEMTKAFNETYVQYKQLTDAEKASPYGKALSESLDQLKDRVQETKTSLKEAADILNGNSGGGEGGGGGITGMLQVFGGNMLTKGVSMLTSELTDAWTESIKLAREGEGVRLAFERLNEPGLLDNLKQATHGTVSEIELMKQAIKFENFKLPLEDLAIYLQFAQQKAKDTGESIDFLVTSIVNGLGRQSKQILDNLGISASELTKRMAEGKDMTQAVAEIIREEMAKAGDYVETAADRAAVAAASATDKLEEMGRTAMPVAEAVTEMWKTIRNGGITVLNTVLTPIANSLKYINDLLSNENGIELFEKRLGNTPGMEVGPNVDDNGNYIRRPSHGTLGWNWNTGHYDDEVSSIQEIVVSGTNRKGGGRKGGGSKTDPTEMIRAAWDKARVQSMNGADKLKPSDYIEQPGLWKQYAEGIKGTFESIEDPMSNLTKWTKDFDPLKQKMDDLAKAAQVHKQAMSLAGQATEGFGAALQSIGDPAAKAAGVVVSAIANIVMGFSMASAQAAAVGVGWGWLAWIGAGLAALTTTISTVHNLTGYAEGGMVNGSTYSGDQIPIMANAGEVVLTKAQQGNLASQLQGGGLQNLKLDGVVTGENIHIVHNRYLQRTGQGELVTW